MKISYAITVCNEFVEIQRLVNFLVKNKRSEDEIVILFDSKNGTKDIEDYLRAKSINNEFSWHSKEFNNHFADWKNYLTTLCKGDYIYQIDADEMVSTHALLLIPQIIETNPTVEVYRVPRINTVKGLTQEHIQKWGWVVDNKGWVNFPDPQWRIYKNDSKIKWENKVHEVLVGYKNFSELPHDEILCLEHHKNISKQEKQNNYYNTL